MYRQSRIYTQSYIEIYFKYWQISVTQISSPNKSFYVIVLLLSNLFIRCLRAWYAGQSSNMCFIVSIAFWHPSHIGGRSGTLLSIRYPWVAWQCPARNLFTIISSHLELAKIVFYGVALLLIAPNFCLFVLLSLVQSSRTFALINEYQSLYSTPMYSYGFAAAAPAALSVSSFPATQTCPGAQQNFTDALSSACIPCTSWITFLATCWLRASRLKNIDSLGSIAVLSLPFHVTAAPTPAPLFDPSVYSFI